MFFLFTTPTCPNCPRAKQWAEQSSLDVILVDASSTEGLALAQRYNILKVPTLVQVDGSNKVIQIVNNVDDILEFSPIQ